MSQENEAKDGSERWSGVGTRRKERRLRKEVKGEDELRREGRSGGWVEKLEPRAIMRRSRSESSFGKVVGEDHWCVESPPSQLPPCHAMFYGSGEEHSNAEFEWLIN